MAFDCSWTQHQSKLPTAARCSEQEAAHARSQTVGSDSIARAAVDRGLTEHIGGWLVERTLLDSVVEDVDQPALADTAGQLIPAVGVLFALLTAFVITNQRNRSRSAEQVVGKEADACIRLALASQSPGIDGQRVRSLLVDYLRAVLDAEWDTLRHERAGSPRVADALSRLERDVRADATTPGTATAVTADLLAAAGVSRCREATG